MHVYLVTNRTNGKKYVGQTRRAPAARWPEHLWKVKRGCTFLFHRAIRKYGPDVFEQTVLATAQSQEELDALEIEWIVRLNTMSPAGYNTKLGKQGHPSEEVRLRVSQSLFGRKKTPEHARHISEGKKGCVGAPGRKMPREAVERTRAKLKARPVTQANIDHLNRVRPTSVTEETKVKIGVASKLRGIPLAVSETGWKANRGKKRSEETLAKLRAAWVLWKERACQSKV